MTVKEEELQSISVIVRHGTIDIMLTSEGGGNIGILELGPTLKLMLEHTLSIQRPDIDQLEISLSGKKLFKFQQVE